MKVVGHLKFTTSYNEDSRVRRKLAYKYSSIASTLKNINTLILPSNPHFKGI